MWSIGQTVYCTPVFVSGCDNFQKQSTSQNENLLYDYGLTQLLLVIRYGLTVCRVKPHFVIDKWYRESRL